jgi:hypothetical protein
MMEDTRRLDAALARLQRMASDNLPIGSRITAEREYAQAYDELVRKGLRLRLRAKYRRQ